MTPKDWVNLIFVWNLFGFFVCVAIADMYHVQDWNIANPVKCYKICTNLNIIGALLMSALYNILCPVGSVIYWFCWLCTVGRKENKNEEF